MNREYCLYRTNKPCSNTEPCNLCLMGQQIDSIELLTSAVMDLRIDAMEEDCADAIQEALQEE